MLFRSQWALQLSAQCSTGASADPHQWVSREAVLSPDGKHEQVHLPGDPDLLTGEARVGVRVLAAADAAYWAGADLFPLLGRQPKAMDEDARKRDGVDHHNRPRREFEASSGFW